MAALAGNGKGMLLIDAHVHVYPCYDLELVFESALRNFGRAAEELQLAAEPINWLLLCETAVDHFFRDCRAGRVRLRGWRFRETAEDRSLMVRRADGRWLIMVAGRQIQTREGLEVLALGYHGWRPDGSPVRRVLAEVRAAGAIAVLPWGFGKWTLGRRAILRQLLRSEPPLGFHVADSGNRARAMKPSRLFEPAARRGILNLPGSGPLPFPNEARRIGSFGFALPGVVNLQRPFAELKELIDGQHEQPRVFGHGLAWPPFVRSQLRMQLRKRLRLGNAPARAQASEGGDP
jgi:hypothetical protein